MDIAVSSLPNATVLIARRIRVAVHSHHAVQLILSLDQPFDTQIDQNPWVNTIGFLVDSDVPHQCHSEQCTVLIFNIEPESASGRQLKQTYLTHSPICQLPDLLLPDVLAELQRLYAGQADGPQPDCSRLLQCLLAPTPTPPPLDDRVLRVIQFIKQHYNQGLSTASLADVAALSPGRMGHLFTHQVGISPTRYLLWYRMQRALYGLINDNLTLTEAAHYAGFFDQSHLNRTLRRMFGISPSALLKNSQFIQVIR